MEGGCSGGALKNLIDEDSESFFWREVRPSGFPVSRSAWFLEGLLEKRLPCRSELGILAGEVCEPPVFEQNREEFQQ